MKNNKTTDELTRLRTLVRDQQRLIWALIKSSKGRIIVPDYIMSKASKEGLKLFRNRNLSNNGEIFTIEK